MALFCSHRGERAPFERVLGKREPQLSRRRYARQNMVAKVLLVDYSKKQEEPMLHDTKEHDLQMICMQAPRTRHPCIGLMLMGG